MKLSSLFEEQTLYPFKKDSTDLPHYDDAIKNPEYFKKNKDLQFKLMELSPDQYLEAAAQGFKSTIDKMTGSRDLELVNKYIKNMQDGDKFPMLLLIYNKNGSFSQEGIHRAMAAKKLNIPKVPVMVAFQDFEELPK